MIDGMTKLKFIQLIPIKFTVKSIRLLHSIFLCFFLGNKIPIKNTTIANLWNFVLVLVTVVFLLEQLFTTGSQKQ